MCVCPTPAIRAEGLPILSSPGDLCRAAHAPPNHRPSPGGTLVSPTCPLLPFRVRFRAEPAPSTATSSSTQGDGRSRPLRPSGMAYSRGYPDPDSGSLRLQLDCGEQRPGPLSGPYRTKAAKRTMVRSWRKKHSPASRSLEAAAVPSAMPGGRRTPDRAGGVWAAACKPCLRGHRLLPAPRKEGGKQGRGEGPEAAVGKGGGIPSQPGQLEGEGFVCFALLRSAFRWLPLPGRVCCAPGVQTPKRKRKRKEPNKRVAARVWEAAVVTPCRAELGLRGPRAGPGSPRGERLRAGAVVVAGPLGAAAGKMRALAQPLRGAAALGRSSRPQTSARCCWGGV